MKNKSYMALIIFAFMQQAYAESPTTEQALDIIVHRSPTCSCCGKWIDHLKQNNFNVKDIVTENVQGIKDQNGISKELSSCHTALVGGYFVEGHVPAEDIKTMLKNKPNIAGLSVPGMPSGTPGMEMGGRKDPYQVISIGKDKKVDVYHNYEAK